MIIKPKVPLILRRECVRDVYYMSCMCVHTQTLRHPHIWAYTFSHLADEAGGGGGRHFFHFYYTHTHTLIPSLHTHNTYPDTQTADLSLSLSIHTH